jgi:uncharacterized membrane protein
MGSILLACLFIIGGLVHLLRPDIYKPVMPAWLPAHDLLILVSGVAELLGGAGLLVTRSRRAASIGLILLLIAVFPANVEMLRVYQLRGSPLWVEALLWIRLPLQLVLVWWVWRTGRPGDSARI